MIPKRSTTRFGSTSANSVIVCPCSLLMFVLFLNVGSHLLPGALAARGGLPGYGQAAYGSSLATLIRPFPTWAERPFMRKTDVALIAHSTRAYSFVVCARSSFRRSFSSLISLLNLIRLSPHFRVVLLGLELADDRVDRTRNPRGEQTERDDDAQRDHCQDNAVFGHRLTLFQVEARVQVRDPIRERERHGIHLLPDLTCASGDAQDKGRNRGGR